MLSVVLLVLPSAANHDAGGSLIDKWMSARSAPRATNHDVASGPRFGDRHHDVQVASKPASRLGEGLAGQKPCAREAAPDAVPFVMWMSERTGSSWAQYLLNSHPNISMQGEIFNHWLRLRDADGSADHSADASMCGLLTSRRAPKARGFKQKFLFCGDELERRSCLRPDGRRRAL
jgi:hypothetical protein